MIPVFYRSENFTSVRLPADLRCIEDYSSLKNDLTLDTAATAAWIIDKINKTHAVILRYETGSATIEERDTWQLKANAAAAHIADSATPAQTAGLTAEADAVGVSVDDLAAVITQKSNEYALLIGTLSGMRRAAIANVNAAETANDALAIFEQFKTDMVEFGENND